MKPGIDYIGVSAGVIILNDKNEILLSKRSKKTRNEQGKWEAPGGVVHFFETREQTVKREIKEELGIEIEIIEPLHTSDEILKKDKQHWVPTTYITRIKKNQTPKIMEPEKCDEIGWFDLKDVPKNLSYITKLDIKEYKKYLKRNSKSINLILRGPIYLLVPCLLCL